VLLDKPETASHDSIVDLWWHQTGSASIFSTYPQPNIYSDISSQTHILFCRRIFSVTYLGGFQKKSQTISPSLWDAYSMV